MALEFDLNTLPATETDVDCLILGIFSDKSFTASGKAVDAASGGKLSALAERGDLKGATGSTALLFDLAGIKASRVLVVGLGDVDNYGTPQYLKAVGDAARALRNGAIKSALFTLSETAPKGRDSAWAIQQAIIAADHACYRYLATLGVGNKKRKESGLEKFVVQGEDRVALSRGIAIAGGVAFTRELGNLPPNICNPAYLAEQAQSYADKIDGVSCEVLDDAQMEALGMGSLLAVARGSRNRPKLIVLKWQGGGEAKPYVMVGKGITFDTGGINLKTQGGIEEMKYDMCGAATVLGTFVSAVGMQLPINVITVVAAVENMPDGNAYRPSDVLTSMSGKTIEVGNTDAEGRLILCDALTYATRFEPKALIDVATLTGAMVVALGKFATGLMTKKDDDLVREIIDAGETTFDRGWQLPLWDEYQGSLDSAFADIYNIGGRWAGAITAGCFLSRFTEGQRWAHLDIAGVSNGEGKLGMATGRPVGMLSQWLLNESGKH